MTAPLRRPPGPCDLSARVNGPETPLGVLRYLLFFAILAGTVLVAWELGQRGARAYERMVVARVTNGLDVLGFTWAEIRADGLKLELHGHAPDAFARDLAVETVRATAPLATVTSYATTTLAPPERRDPVRVEFLRDPRGITLIGQTASRDMRARLNRALSRAGPELTIRDLTGIQAAQPPRGWGPEIIVASIAATRLPNAHVVMQPGSVAVDGQVTDQAERDALTRELADAAGTRVALNLNLRLPAQLIAPFAFTVQRNAGGPLRLERCAARDAGEMEEIEERLGLYETETLQSACRTGLGAPEGDWGEAVLAGIEALRDLPAARFDLEYTTARLIALPPTDPDDFAPVRSAFLAALPDGFSGTATLRPVDVATRSELAQERHWLRLSRGAEGLRLAGLVPDDEVRAAITTFARARFGAEAIADGLTLSHETAPADWQRAAIGMLDALARVAEGEGQLAGYTIALSLRSEDPALARQVHDRLTADFTGYAVSTVVQIDLPQAVYAIPLPGRRCAALMNRLYGAAPIEFDPGSDRIAASAAPVLSALADILGRCEGARIEIGGHTDAQGSEEMNQALSRGRAEAVMTALLDLGVPELRLSAIGYGETRPIADNATEVGRALNRRIEFRAIGEEAVEENVP